MSNGKCNSHNGDLVQENSSEPATQNLIKFVEILPNYQPHEDIFVVYELPANYQPASRDWIGLYPENWQNANDYLNFQWAPKSAQNQRFPNIRSVVFYAGECDVSINCSRVVMFFYSGDFVPEYIYFNLFIALLTYPYVSRPISKDS